MFSINLFHICNPEYPSSMLNAQRSLLTKLSITDLIIQCIAAAATAGAGAAVHADCATANCAAFALVTTHSLSFKQSDREGWRAGGAYLSRATWRYLAVILRLGVELCSQNNTKLPRGWNSVSGPESQVILG